MSSPRGTPSPGRACRAPDPRRRRAPGAMCWDSISPRRPRLQLEALEELGIGGVLGGDDLDGDPPARAGVARLVHGAHPALTQEAGHRILSPAKTSPITYRVEARRCPALTAIVRARAGEVESRPGREVGHEARWRRRDLCTRYPPSWITVGHGVDRVPSAAAIAPGPIAGARHARRRRPRGSGAARAGRRRGERQVDARLRAGAPGCGAASPEASSGSASAPGTCSP